MHVKYIHDLCTLPLDIPPYLHHILVIFILFDDYLPLDIPPYLHHILVIFILFDDYWE
jgi:hypothetical protein